MKKLTTINKALKEFTIAQRIIKEDYGIGQDPMEMGMGPEMEMQDISHYRGGEKPMPQEEENTDMNLSKSDKRIAQIREIALDGLQDYAQDVDCEAYQFYKKIWLMCDKAVSEKESASNGGSAA